MAILVKGVCLFVESPFAASRLRLERDWRSECLNIKAKRCRLLKKSPFFRKEFQKEGGFVTGVESGGDCRCAVIVGFGVFRTGNFIHFVAYHPRKEGCDSTV